MEVKTSNNLDIVKLLSNKVELLNKVLKITEPFAEKINEQKAEDYVSLMDKRQILFQNLASVDGKLKALGFDNTVINKEVKSNSDISLLTNQIKKVAEQIFKIDKSLSGPVDMLMAEVRSNLKNMISGKNVTNVYSDNAYNGVSRFDSRN